ncbi:hypothetical protein BGX30_013725, partial [Mortierella sp. GBA39]
MKINSCVLIAMATALSLMAGFTDAKRDRHDAQAADAVAANQDSFAAPAADADGNAAIVDPNELWKHKHKHHGKHHHHGHHGHHHVGKHHGKHHHGKHHDHHDHDHHHCKHHGKHHKKCKTETVVVFAPCTKAGGGEEAKPGLATVTNGGREATGGATPDLVPITSGGETTPTTTASSGKPTGDPNARGDIPIPQTTTTTAPREEANIATTASGAEATTTTAP